MCGFINSQSPAEFFDYLLPQKESRMKSMFITTILGPDSPGVIKALAHTTRGLGGEWTTSKVMKLDGQFTAMMKVVIDESVEAKLKETLEKEFTDLQFIYAPGLEKKTALTETINLVIDCKDRPGLTKDINNILSNLDLVVEHMEFSRAHVSSIGEAVFTAKLAVAVAEGTDGETLAEEIESSLSDDIRVNVI